MLKVYLRRFAAMLLFMILLLLLTSAASIYISRLKGEIIDRIFVAGRFDIAGNLLSFAVALLFLGPGGYLLGLVRYQLVRRLSQAMKNDIMRRVLHTPRNKVLSLDTAEIVTLYTAKMDMVENNFLSIAGRILEYLTVILMTLFALFHIDPLLTVLALILYIAPVFATRTFQNSLTRVQKEYMQTRSAHNDEYLTQLNAIEMIKSYQIEQQIERQFEQSLDELTQRDLRRGLARARTNALSSLLTYLPQGLIAAYCIYQLSAGRLSIGILVTVFSLVSALSAPIYWIARSYESMISAYPSLRDVLDFLNEAGEAVPPDPQSQKAPDKSQAPLLQIEHLSFAYGDAPLLHDINLSIANHEKILLCGPSGSGKSSLIQLILGYLEPDAGTIHLNGRPLCELDFPEQMITLASQEAILFEGTIGDNLFTSESETAQREMLRNVGLETVNASDGLAYPVEANGRNLSGGQKKRIALVRSFMADGRLLILDEPLANIDPANIERIEERIERIQDRAVLIISHQISERLLKAVDRCYRLQDGALNEVSATALLETSLISSTKSNQRGGNNHASI